MVVTAYQSNHVNDLKKKHNKFASGFRAERGGKRSASASASESPDAKRTPSTEFLLRVEQLNVIVFARD
uniref:T-box domain-containing protein n=1 Tax=Caenorhabditis japonica TaxID=281687 RepID=A0A8R1IDQ6_CAEJA